MAIHSFLLFLFSLPTSTFSYCSSTYCDDDGLNAGTAIPNKAPLRLGGRRLRQVCAPPPPPPTLAPPPPPQPPVPIAPFLPVVPPPPFPDGQGSSSCRIWMYVALLAIVVICITFLLVCCRGQQQGPSAEPEQVTNTAPPMPSTPPIPSAPPMPSTPPMPSAPPCHGPHCCQYPGIHYY